MKKKKRMEEERKKFELDKSRFMEKVSVEKTDLECDARVVNFLHSLELERYIPMFAARNYKFKDLFHLKDNDLKEIGIKAAGPRRKILNGINDLLEEKDGLEGFIKKLLKAAQSTQYETAEKAFNRLKTLAEKSGRNRVLICQLNGIAILIHIIKTTKSAVIQALAVELLALLVRENECKVEVLRVDGIEPLTYLADLRAFAGESHTLEYVLLTLKRIIKIEDNKKAVRERNIAAALLEIADSKLALPTILALDVLSTLSTGDVATQNTVLNTPKWLEILLPLLDSEESEIKEQAIKSLGAISSGHNKAAQYKIANSENLLEKFASHLDLREEDELQAASVLSMAYICESEDPMIKFLVKNNLLRSIVQLLHSSSEIVQRDSAKAVSVLCKGSTKKQMQRLFRSAITIGPLCELAHSPNFEVRCEAMGALLELAHYDTKNISLIFSSLGVEPILEGLHSPDLSMQYFSAGLMLVITHSKSASKSEFRHVDTEGVLNRLAHSTTPEIRDGCKEILKTIGPLETIEKF